MSWFRNPFRRGPVDTLGDDMRAAAATFVQRTMEAGATSGYVLTMRKCTLRGLPVGDWEFTARRLDACDNGSDPQGEDAKRLSASASQSGPEGDRPNNTTTPIGDRG